MTLYQNELGEFVDYFDPYQTDRKKIYANCRVRKGERIEIRQEPDRDGTEKPLKRKQCPECGRKFLTSENAKKFCSKECRIDAYNTRRRRLYREAKKKGRSND